MKTLGIIGGLGPETTAKFYLELIFQCQKNNKINRPSILIHSVPISYRIEEEAIAKGRGEERCIPLLVAAARNLEMAGADFLVMPCNSLHAFIGEIRESVKIPVFSIVEATTEFLESKETSEVGILATSITLKRELYERYLQPSKSQQARIGKIIHNLVSGRSNEKDKRELIKIITSFENRGVKNIILACTDLQLLLPQHPRLKIYDTMQIFADATAKEMLK